MRSLRLANLVIATVAAIALVFGGATIGRPDVTAHAASLPAPANFGISGAVRQIASPAAYAGPTSLFFNAKNIPVHIPVAYYYVVSGQLVGGQYQYPYHLSARHGYAAAAIELAIDPAAHTQLIEAGVPTAQSVAAVQAEQPKQGYTKTSTVGTLSRPHSVSQNTSSGSGWYETIWHDPVNIILTQVKDTINFTYDGTYVDSFSGSDYRYWFWDGWGENAHSIGSYYNYNYTNATVWTYDHFSNGIFCAFQTTHVYYSDNNVDANQYGGVGGYVNTWASGGCTNLISYYSVIS